MLAIDSVGAKHGGAATVACDVVDAALRSENVSHVIVFCSPAHQRHFSLPDDERLSVVDCGPWVESGLGRLIWLSGGFERASRRRGALALLALNGGGLEPDGSSAGRRTVLVQQSLPFWRERRRYLELRAEPRIQLIKWAIRQGCRRARTVVVQSPSMRDALCLEFSLDPRKVAVLPPGPSLCDVKEELARIPPLVGPGRNCRLLYVGSSATYKNLQIVPKAMALLRQAGLSVEFVATIEPGHELCRTGLVKPLGYLDRTTLLEEFRQADVLIMPSLVETVGLPMLEAMATGLPVVAADRPYAHDTCRDAAIYFDPLNSVALADSLKSVITNPTIRTRLRQTGVSRATELAHAKPYERLIEMAAS